MAPKDERGLMSTKWAPTLMEDIMATALPPPIFVIKSGTSGINVGNTTPDELENAEKRPVVKAVTAVTFCGVDTFASIWVSNPNPPHIFQDHDQGVYAAYHKDGVPRDVFEGFLAFVAL